MKGTKKVLYVEIKQHITNLSVMQRKSLKMNALHILEKQRSKIHSLSSHFE